jgi:hypothetical protein
MTTLPSAVSVRFTPDGVAGVDASVRLGDFSRIYCHRYGGAAPVLSIVDAHVALSVGVPDPGHVTVQDVTRARELAAAVARYAAELERLATGASGPAGPDCPERVV